MADDLQQAQQRALLAEMARAGSAATAAFQEGQTALAEQRKQALASSVGASAQPGGINDVGALIDRRMALASGANADRQADIGQRTTAYTQDLGLAGQANVARRAEVDRDVGVRRVEMDRETARRKADMEHALVLRRMEVDAKKREAQSASYSPEQEASRIRAEMFLADPTGEKEERRKATIEATQAAGRIDSNEAVIDEARADLGLDDKADRWTVMEAILLQDYPPDLVAEIMRTRRPAPAAPGTVAQKGGKKGKKGNPLGGLGKAAGAVGGFLGEGLGDVGDALDIRRIRPR